MEFHPGKMGMNKKWVLNSLMMMMMMIMMLYTLKMFIIGMMKLIGKWE